MNRTALKRLPRHVRRPKYVQRAVGASIVHIGPGAFHRAHQATYFDQALAQGYDHCGIVGISLHSNALAKALATQDGLYSVMTKAAAETNVQVIGALQQTICARTHPRFAMDALVSERTKLVTMTVTEKGYCHQPSSGQLDFSNPAIQHDLDRTKPATSMPALLVRSLESRRQIGREPFIVMSCDNLSDNGTLTKNVLTQFATTYDSELAEWIRENVPCPSTVVDRITPGSTAEDKEQLANALGFCDDAMVVTEPYSQWIVSRHNQSTQYPWPEMGVSLVDDVAPYEAAKLRLLNAPHSALAYFGLLTGKATIADTMSDGRLTRYVEILLKDELAPTVNRLDAGTIENAVSSTLQRFSNSEIRHNVHQIGTDGSQKLPQRLLAPLRDRMETHASMDAIVLAIVAWGAYVLDIFDANGDRQPVDPLAHKYRDLRATTPRLPNEICDALLSLTDVFAKEFQSSSQFRQRFVHWMGRMINVGPQTTLSEFLTNYNRTTE